MKKGDVITVDGKRFRIQKVISDSVYASLMISDDKCQRGKPRRFRFDELAKTLGTSVESLKNDLTSNKVIMKEQLKQVVAEEAEGAEETEEVEASAPVKTTTSASSQKSPLHDVLNQYEDSTS